MDILLLTAVGAAAAFFTMNPLFLVAGVILGVISQSGRKKVDEVHEEAMIRIETAASHDEANAAMVGSFLRMAGWTALMLLASLAVLVALLGGGL